MKNIKLWPLLLLLLHIVTQRSSDAGPVNVIANLISKATVEGLIDITKGLTEAVGWFEKKIGTSFKLDEAISKLETQMGELPIEVGAIHQNVLEGLYTSQSRVTITRSLLETIARKLKSQCDGLIGLYSRNEVSSKLFTYSVKRFVKLASNAKTQLQSAFKLYQETHDELVKAKIILKSYNFKLDQKEIIVEEGNKEEIDNLKTTFILVTVFTLGLGAPIAYPIIYGQIGDLEDKLNAVKGTIDLIQETVGELVDENEDLSNYILKEINLIQTWESQLLTSVTDHEEMTPEDIQFGIPMIKENLVALRDACMNYISHALPGILRSLISEI